MSRWWAEGLLFENCNCTAVCPGHVHFSQACTHEVCHGFWTIRFRGGEVDGVNLTGVDMVVIYVSPQTMIHGNWTQLILIDEGASDAQARVAQSLIQGAYGPPWAILSEFVGEHLPLRRAPITIEDAPMAKTVTIPGILRGVVESLRGRDKTQPVRFENIYNQIHNASQVVARGSTEFEDSGILISTEGSHGLWSDFRWEGTHENGNRAQTDG